MLAGSCFPLFEAFSPGKCFYEWFYFTRKRSVGSQISELNLILRRDNLLDKTDFSGSDGKLNFRRIKSDRMHFIRADRILITTFMVILFNIICPFLRTRYSENELSVIFNLKRLTIAVRGYTTFFTRTWKERYLTFNYEELKNKWKISIIMKPRYRTVSEFFFLTRVSFNWRK